MNGKTPKYNKSEIMADYVLGASLPDLHKKYGISVSYAHEIMSKAGLNRSISESQLLKGSGTIDWHRLVRVGKRNDGNKSQTRIISLPAFLLLKLGYNPESQLIAKWTIIDGVLTLQIKEGAKVPFERVL